MLKTTLIVCGLALASAGWPLAATAQEAATLVMRNGERLGVELVDLGGVGFTVRVNGQERRVPPGEVAVIEFTGGAPSPQALERLNSGRPVVVLRNGDVIEGRLYDIGGTHPLRITIDTPSGQRDFTSNEVAQIYYTNPGPTVATNGSQAAQSFAFERITPF